MPAAQISVEIDVMINSNIIIGASSWAPNIMIEGKLYPGRILYCPEPIGPGESGAIILGFLYEGAMPDVGSGKKIEFRDGPSTIVAKAVVV